MKICYSIFTILLVSLISSGCTTSTNVTPLPTVAQPQLFTAIPTLIPTDFSEPIPVLPHSLYFLDDLQGSWQVWKLGTDGTTIQKMTDIEGGVRSFAISPKDGRMAYISNNQLFLLDKDRKNPILIADGNMVSKSVEDYVFRSEVSSPSFSPDGQILAYGFNGLHLYYLDSGEDIHLLTNLGNLLGETFVFTKEIYVPGSWSPDGKHLLIIMSYYEGSTLAVMDLNSEPLFRRLRSNGPVCCIFNWSKNGSSLWVANPYFTVDLPGLWKFDIETGTQSEIIKGIEDDGSLNYVGWPIQLETGELLLFYVNLENFSPDIGIPLKMFRSDMNGIKLTQVRPETFNISEVLWSQDGSLAIILHRNNENGKKQLILVKTDGSPIQTLIETEVMRNVKWGP